jgi:hypothetical protein
MKMHNVLIALALLAVGYYIGHRHSTAKTGA